MLRRLTIERIALIDSLELEFCEGLNILTGETGAGKSIIIDAIGLILGDRVNRELIKAGAQKAYVEAEFDISACKDVKEYLASMEYEVYDELLVSRELYATGKTVARINGAPASVAILKALTAQIVDVHGQHEHQSLLLQSKHMRYLDAYGGTEIEEKRSEVASLYSEYKAAKAELDFEFMPEDERMRRIDILSYQLKEIDAEGLTLGMEESLIEEQNLLVNAERIMQTLANTQEALGGEEFAAASAVNSAAKQLDAIANISAQYGEVAQKLSDAYYLLEDALYAVRHMRDDFEFDTKRLDEVGNKLYRLSALKRKYGPTVEAIINFRNECEQEYVKLTSADERRHKLEKQCNRLWSQYIEAAGKLSALRKIAAAALEEKVTKNLIELGMKNAKFLVHIDEAQPLSHGCDRVEFFITANAGEEPKPLAKVASGGELSRIMLALKTIIAGADDINLLIFDEIDTGISGKTSTIVGEKLSSVAKEHQVLCVTHSPQIAAFADNHIFVEKHESEGYTSTFVTTLSLDERISEIARIMGGAESKTALLHAKELIEMCEKLKA